MPRTYGRSQRGTRVIEGVPFGRRKTTTFVRALRVTGFTAPLTVDVRSDRPLHLSGMGMAASRSRAGSRRHRRNGPPVESQCEMHSGSDRIGGRRSPLSATIFTRVESDRL